MSYKVIVDSCGELTAEMKASGRFETASLGLEVGDCHIIDDESFNQAEFLKNVADSPICPHFIQKLRLLNRSAIQILLGMFNASDEMLTIGVPALRIIGIHYLIAWFCIVSGTVFQALGKAFFSMIVSIMRQLFVLIPAAYILAKLGGLHVVWWSFPIAEVISLMVSSFFLVRINRTIISRVPEGKL